MSFPWISDRLYLAGFIDHTFNQEPGDGFPTNPIVAEAQFGWNVIDNWFFIAEYRLNEYRREDVNNLALGVEYKIKW